MRVFITSLTDLILFPILQQYLMKINKTKLEIILTMDNWRSRISEVILDLLDHQAFWWCQIGLPLSSFHIPIKGRSVREIVMRLTLRKLHLFIHVAHNNYALFQRIINWKNEAAQRGETNHVLNEQNEESLLKGVSLNRFFNCSRNSAVKAL